MKLILTCLFVFLLTINLCAQVTVNNAVNGTDGVQNVLLGSGVTASNITFSGNNAQIGSYTCSGLCTMGISSGLVMGSGNIDQVPGNGGGGSTMGPASGTGASDPDLVAIAGASINDAAILQFDFVPTGDTIEFRFVFGSDEYPEFVNSGFNDAFGFFLSGPGISGSFTNGAVNIALLPNGVTPITINNVNSGVNSSFYVTNTGGANNIECDGYTVVLTASAVVECGQTYNFKLAIGDAGDTSYDSFVFLEAGSFESNSLDLSFLQPGISPETNGLFEGCPEGNVLFTRPPGVIGDLVYNLSYSGTATSGADYNTLPNFISIPDGLNSALLPISAFDDGFGEGTETIVINVVSSVECATGINLTLTIFELAPLAVSVAPVVVPCNEDAEVMLSITGGFGNYQVNWGSFGLGNPLLIPNPVNSQINYMVTDVCSVDPFSGTIDINLQQYAPIQTTIGSDLVLDCNDAAIIPPNTIGGNGIYTFEWFVDGASVSSDEILTINDPTNSEVAVIVTDGCGATGTDSLNIILPIIPVMSDLPIITSGTCNGTVDITAQISGGVGGYTYQWFINDQLVGTAPQITTISIQDQDVILIVTDECDNQAQDTTSIQIPPTPISVSLGSDLTLTCLDIITINATVSGGTGNYQYQWSINNSLVSSSVNYEVNLDATEQIVLTVNDECNASGNDEIVINVPPVPVVINLNPTIEVVCLQNFSVAANNVTGGVGALQYSWLLNDLPYSQNSSFSYNTSSAVSFVLNVTDACGNEATDIIAVNLLPSLLSIETTANNDNICPQVAVALDAAVSNAIGNVSYLWSTSSSNSSITVNPDVTTTYLIGVTDACGANVTDEITINVLTQTGPLSVVLEESVCINVSTSDLLSGGYLPYVVTYNIVPYIDYNPQSGTFISSQIGNFDFTVVDQCGFQQSGSVIIESCETIIPNVFSPNDDGKNDVFEIRGIEGFRNSTLTVWNRWGNMVYESSNYNNEWGGGDHNEGVYYYIFKRVDGENFEGSVQIIR